MAKLTLEIPDVVTRRLDALANISGKSVEELALEGIESFAGSFASRRTIVKAWRAAAQIPGTTYSLADLGWLNGYAGQTLDELLAFEGTEGLYQVLGALEQAIEEKLKADGAGQMTGVMLVVLSVMALVREVNNGGYGQFFFNSSRRFAPRIVNDLVRIGCTEIADVTQRALDSLEVSKVTVAAIEEVLKTESVARKRTLERCNIAFYERTELPERLFAYVELHQAGIRI